jgi:VIT1/CCC1 family predicted Fe2+/Mn2+ transporter
MPFILGLGDVAPLAFWLSVATGIAAFILTVLTDHHLGIFKVLPYQFHLAVDFLVGVVFVLAPFLLGFSGLEATYYWVLGGTVLLVVGLHKTEDELSVA